MLPYILQAGLLAIALLACIFLPFLPGPHDATAIILSSIAQTIGFAAVLLIPIGATWFLFGSHRAIRMSAAVTASAVITLAAALGATINNSFYLAIGLLMLGAYLSFRFVGWSWRREIPINRFDSIPLYFILIPLLILTARIAFIERAVEFSRNLAIENSRPLIQAIEAYHARTGQYPESLHSELEDYDPNVIGIPRYYYEQNGEAYNLFFEQFSNEIGTREFVMYNKLGEHRMHGHNADRLELSPADQIRQQGWHRVVNLPQENWKYFHFD